MGTLDLAARAVPAVTEQSKEREEEEEDKKREKDRSIEERFILFYFHGCELFDLYICF